MLGYIGIIPGPLLGGLGVMSEHNDALRQRHHSPRQFPGVQRFK